MNNTSKNGRFSIDFLEFYSKSKASSTGKNIEIFPAMIDMRMMYPLPVYYSYSLRRSGINLDDLAAHIDDVFNCIIYGERGTARSSIAFIIYNLLVQEHEIPAFRIEASLLDESIFYKIFELPNSPLEQVPSFLFFHELHMMPLPLQDKLYRYLVSHQHRCIATLRAPAEAHIKTGNLNPQLAALFQKKSYYMPPLRGNAADITFICHLLLNHYNAEYSRQILGFTSESEKILQKYDWPGNITQLSQIMSVLVMQTSEPYIPDSMLRFYLYDDGSKASSQSFWLHLDLSMTLAEINQYIADCVLRQENWNQSKAAKRLGISRSTLWRMIRNSN